MQKQEEKQSIQVDEEPEMRSVGTQSVYRESSTQTLPYSPDYIIEEGQLENDPFTRELIALESLHFGQGLPITRNEMRLIQNLREKMEFDRSLPTGTDSASFAKRKKMLEEREIAEWMMREQEMKKEQALKLAAITEAINEREAKSDEQVTVRLQEVKMRLNKEKERITDAIENKRVKYFRALDKSMKLAGGRLAKMIGGERQLNSTRTNSTTSIRQKRDIINEYSNFGSQVYAPQTRNGYAIIRNETREYNLPQLQSTAGLQELSTQINKYEQSQQRRDAEIQNRIRVSEQELQSSLNNVDKLAESDIKEQREVRNVYKKFQPVQRARTPTLAKNHPALLSRVDQSIILLQRLLRTRAAQVQLETLKTHEQHLIHELRHGEHPPVESTTDDSEADPLDGIDSLTAAAIDAYQGEIFSSTVESLLAEKQRIDTAINTEIMKPQEHVIKQQRGSEAAAGTSQAKQLLAERQEENYNSIISIDSNSAERRAENPTNQTSESSALSRAQNETHKPNQDIESIEQSQRQHEEIAKQVAKNHSKATIVNALQNAFPDLKIDQK